MIGRLMSLFLGPSAIPDVDWLDEGAASSAAVVACATGSGAADSAFSSAASLPLTDFLHRSISHAGLFLHYQPDLCHRANPDPSYPTICSEALSFGNISHHRDNILPFASSPVARHAGTIHRHLRGNQPCPGAARLLSSRKRIAVHTGDPP